MELTASLVEEHAREYREREALYAVEDEHLEMLPGMFAAGDFGRRDAEWPVQWYFRRYLGAYPDRERREVEEAFAENEFETVLETLQTVAAGGSDRERVERLTDLSGVDVRVASAFLQFVLPERYVVVGDRSWATLHAAGELDRPYPGHDALSVEAYLSYLETCRELADRLACDLQTLYRALWRLWERRGTEIEPLDS